MKIGHYSSRWIALKLLVLLKTITLVLTQESQQCQQLKNTCSTEVGTSTQPLVALATGQESRMATCNPPFDLVMAGDELQWFFTSTTKNNANPVNIDNTEKYSVSGARSQMLTVKKINSSDEGYYYCQIFRGGRLLEQNVSGACLYVYNTAVFQSCSGNGNMNMPQEGCSGIESLPSLEEGQPVTFNIALIHKGPKVNCFDQTIQMITFRKADSSDSLVECSNSSCKPFKSNLRVNRTMNMFDINVTLNDLTLADSGNYTAIADIRRPSNNMRVCIYKNFSLDVSPSLTTTPTTTDNTPAISSETRLDTLSQSSLIAIIVVIVVLVTLLIALGVFVAILLLWTYKNHRAGQNTTTGAKNEVYETIGKITKSVFRRDKKRNNGVSLNQESMYRRSITEEEKVTLQEALNSESSGV